MNIERAKRGIEYGAAAVAVYWLLNNAFTRDVRKAIEKRDNYTCQVTGRTEAGGWYLMASHYFHKKDDPGYNDPRSGQLLCVAAHLEYHLDHAPEEIGLTPRQNNYAIMKLRETDAKRWGYEGIPVEPDGTPNYDYNAHQRPGWRLNTTPPVLSHPLNQVSLEKFNEALFG